MADLTYMDCWHYIAPLMPIGSETAQEIYVMVFQALQEAEERRKGEWLNISSEKRRLH